MYKLKQGEYKIAKGIFKELNFNIVINSVINGNTPGEIYVDDIDDPKNALVWDMMGELLIEGESDNSKFDMEVKNLILNDLMPRAKERYVPSFDFYYSKNFESKLNLLLDRNRCTKTYRNVYKFENLRVNWRDNIQEKCSMVIIDKEFLSREDLQHIWDVKGWINSFWYSEEEFITKGIGYCLIKESVVVSWCLSVFVDNKNFEFGLETIEDYRGNSYGKLTAAACMDYCIENNIIPFWQCNKTNIPSNKVSESVGFQKDFEYSVEIFQF